jgi:hypothetical protein
MVGGIVVGLPIMLCWAADEEVGDSPDELRARLGRFARWFGWAAVAIFVLTAIFANMDGTSEMWGAGAACIAALMGCVVTWVVLKALSLPN